MRQRWIFGPVAVAAGLAAVAGAGAFSAGAPAPARSGAGAPLAFAASGARSFASASSGIGLTVPTKGSGARIKGGTVTFAQMPASPPNNVFPMYSAQYCGTPNVNMLDDMLFQPLYSYGDNYKPTVDYADSIGKKPIVSNGGRTYTIKLNHYLWSNGEPVTARDLVFWMNVLEANPATEWCGTVAGLFPYNVKSYKALNASTFRLTFKRAYNPTWVQYNEFSQLTPMPLAWDRTSLSQPAPTKASRHLPDTNKKTAGAIYTFLNKQGTATSTWASSPLWDVVDGPFRLTGMTSNGQVTLTANAKYSGFPKPSIHKLVEEPFTTDTAEFNEVKAGGPNALTIGSLPAQDQPQSSAVTGEGYLLNKGASYSVNFFPLNFNNPTVGPVFRQLYFRQAFQHLIDQKGWIQAILKGTAFPTYGPIPTSPSSPLISGVPRSNPYPFAVSAAKKLLSSNGWKVVPNGSTTCVKPGFHHGECGAGIKAGEKISFNIDYVSGSTAITSEMANLQAQAKLVGINISLTNHNFNDIVGQTGPCTPKQAKCDWTALNWGAGWIYGPDYYPSGEALFANGSVSDYSNNNDPKMNKLVQETITAPQSKERAVMAEFVRYAEKTLPLVFEPTSIGTFGASAGTLVSKKLGGYTANALGIMHPQNWYLTK